jgi:hypothetical protein
MSIGKEIKYANVDDLYLDPKNPRLGRHNTEKNLSQSEILNLMQDWAVDELAISYLESGGFWVQEALIVVEEVHNNVKRLVVVEGNRRLAALKLLKLAREGSEKAPRKWLPFFDTYALPPDLFEEVPFLQAATREDVQSFLGFRHVTGIKEWAPAEQAEFIAKLIDQGMSYEEVTKKIGSRLSAVRQKNIGYRLLRQLEEQVEEFDPDLEAAQKRFSVMYLSLRTPSVQDYLQINIDELSPQIEFPVPATNLKRLGNYAKWIFGTDKIPPLFTDSRQMGEFTKMLENPEALEYLETAPEPRFEVARQKAGGDLSELVTNLKEAATLLQVSLTAVHLFNDNTDVKKSIDLISKHLRQMANTFPQIKAEVCKDQ